MAWSFNGSSQYLRGALSVSALPVTLSAWTKADVTNANQTPVSLGTNGSNGNWFRSMLVNTGVVRSQAFENFGTFDDGDSYSTSWGNVVATGTTSSLESFWNGSTDGATASVRNPVSMDRVCIGARTRSGIDQYMDGLIAEVGAWDVVLSDAEIASLAAGACPLFVRRESLIFYLPMRAGDSFIDWVGGVDMGAENGGNDPTATADHPPVFYPRRAWAPTPSVVAAASAPWFFRRNVIARRAV